jgi:hypothetical protein
MSEEISEREQQLAAIRGRKLDNLSHQQDHEKRTMQIRFVEEKGQLIAEGLGRYATSYYPGAFIELESDVSIIKKIGYGVTYTAMRIGEETLELIDGDKRYLARLEDFELGDEVVVMRWKLGKPGQLVKEEE